MAHVAEIGVLGQEGRLLCRWGVHGHMPRVAPPPRRQTTLHPDSHPDPRCVTKSFTLSGFYIPPCDHTRPVDHTTPRWSPRFQAPPRWPKEIRWCRVKHPFLPALFPRPAKSACQTVVCSRNGGQRNQTAGQKQPGPATFCPARLSGPKNRFWQPFPNSARRTFRSVFVMLLPRSCAIYKKR